MKPGDLVSLRVWSTEDGKGDRYGLESWLPPGRCRELGLVIAVRGIHDVLVFWSKPDILTGMQLAVSFERWLQVVE